MRMVQEFTYDRDLNQFHNFPSENVRLKNGHFTITVSTLCYIVRNFQLGMFSPFC